MELPVMSKATHIGTVVHSSTDIHGRIDKAINEGRFQTALELAKQLYKQETTPGHGDLLFRCHLGRARELLGRGATRDAATVLNNALAHAGIDSAKQMQVAEELMACGEIQRALQILEWLPGPKPTIQLLVKGADASLQRGNTGRGLLPPAMQADFDRVRGACGHLAAGRDDEARETLHGIGLQSPFLEWKVLLRGLSGYYQNDDARAIEQWSRLDPARLPSRLAAPLRIRIDPAFCAAQTPQAIQRLQQQANWLQDDRILSGLRTIQQHFLSSQGLVGAFREAEQIVPLIRAQTPQILPQLAYCFYWQMVEQGVPEDRGRYERLFGRPADDPDFHRLAALITELIPEYETAHAAWQEYEFGMAANRPQWPENEARLARAMIWLRMGQNAERWEGLAETMGDVFKGAPLPRITAGQLKPPAAECYRRAAELAPDWIEPQAAIFAVLRKRAKSGAAIAAGHKLLRQFPDHQPTLEALAELHLENGDSATATEMLQRALSGSPLSGALRHKLGNACLRLGVRKSEVGDLAAARGAFESAAGLVQKGRTVYVYGHWAAYEYKAGDSARAEQLRALASTTEDAGPVLAALLFAEAVRLKLPKPVKSRLETEFKQAVAAPATPAAAAGLAALFAHYLEDGFSYHGQKAHQKKILAVVEGARGMTFTERQMRILSAALARLKAKRLLAQFCGRWRQEFPKSPWPAYWEMESFLGASPDYWPLWRVKPLLEQARHRADKMPQGEERDALLNALDARARQFHDLNPFSALFDELRDRYGDDPEDEWEDEGLW
jgi:tetratricopeptide (TPR) repeat protein